MHRSTGSLAILTVALPLVWAAAVDMAVYDFSGCDGTQESSCASWVVCDRVCASSITRSDGLQAAVYPSWPNSMSAYRWSNLDSIPAVPSASEPVTYFEFSLTPVNCEALDLDALTFGEWGKKHGPPTFAVRSSFDNFKNDLLTGSTTPWDDTKVAPSIGVHTVNLNDVDRDKDGTPDFDAITETLTFRIYAYGKDSSSDQTGMWSLALYNDDLLKVTTYGVRIEGTVVPEPAAWMLLAGACSLVGLTHRPRRRRRRQS